MRKISTLVRKMAIPAIVANVVNALYNIVDQIFIGQGVDIWEMRLRILPFQLRPSVWRLV